MAKKGITMMCNGTYNAPGGYCRWVDKAGFVARCCFSARLWDVVVTFCEPICMRVDNKELKCFGIFFVGRVCFEAASGSSA